jgi:uncharacterized membrane protein
MLNNHVPSTLGRFATHPRCLHPRPRGHESLSALSLACRARALLNKVLIAIFVDGVWLHRFWRCHCIPERSFSIEGRQFHVCSRCTGIIAGLCFSWLLLPAQEMAVRLAVPVVLALGVDGLSQLVGLRKSNNLLRFLTGFGSGMTIPAALLWLGGR